MDPQSRIKALSDHGNAVEVEANIPLKRYFRSGMELVKMAKIYEEEGNLESAFILYIRYVTLFVEKMRSHPDYRNHSPVEKGICMKKVKEIFPRAERIKEHLKEKYQQEYAVIVAQQKSLEAKMKQESQDWAHRQTLLEENGGFGAGNLSNRAVGNSQHFNVTPYGGQLVEGPSLEGLAYPTDSLYEGKTKDGYLEAATPSPTPTAPPGPPVVNRGTKPLSLMCTNHDQKGEKLRQILVPENLMERFLTLAHANTSKNVETCGILAGKMALNKFIITHLLVPQQVGTSDSCTTQHEEDLFDQQDKLDLITLGWIHTHPTQTAFLSSVDLHTHCSYQLMMPEAVAIVCAPKFQETGYFTLTPAYGLSYIANCKQNGFHPHPREPPLFQAADHVKLDGTLFIQVVDLRR